VPQVAHHSRVGARLFSELSDEASILEAANNVAEWGYPRPVEQEEIEQADWFRYGDDVVFWFQHFENCLTWFVHLAVSPDGRKRAGLYMGARRWLRFIYAYAKDQGAKELGFARCAGAEATESHLRRLGWADTDYGLAREL
jgi:hypothetical protein